LRVGEEGSEMKEYRFVQVDVFTDVAFGGNPQRSFPMRRA